MKPRNTLLTVTELKKPEERTDAGIVLPRNSNTQYSVCRIIAVGDGGTTYENEQSACRDLRPGQQVLVKLMSSRPGAVGGMQLQTIGVNFKDDEGNDLVLIEQMQVVAILAEPEGIVEFHTEDDDAIEEPTPDTPQIIVD